LEISAWSVLFFLLPAIAAQRLFLMYQAQRQLASDLGVVNRTLERANGSFAEALVVTLDARDRYTAGHSATVAVYARDIAKKLGLTEDEQRLAHLAGMVHDIGKIGVLGGILEKPGPLTLQERRLMEQHSVIGERILAKVEAYAEIATAVRHHHERIDGLGYPDRIAGETIPVISRIVCVADAYNAMTSDRPYRDAMSTEVARSRLRQAAGSQFDPVIVDAFDAILASSSEQYATGTRAEASDQALRHSELQADAA
jgi:putative nucleotidyltransferase with HDIG domain